MARVNPPVVLRHAALLALALLAGCADDGAQSVPDVAAFTVSPREIRVSVSEKGALKAARQILIRPAIPGQAKIMSLIDEGTVVVTGDELARLDDTDVIKEIGELENRVIGLQGQVTAADAELEIQLSQNEADLRDAELELRFAKIEEERFEKGEFVLEKSRRETRGETAESTLATVTRKYEQMPALLEEGFVTPEAVEEERIRKVNAQSDLDAARLELSTYLTYTAPMERQQREADVRNAGLQVGRVQKRGSAREAQKRADLDRQRRELVNVQARLAERREVLSNMVILAPGPGIVVYGDARNPWEDREVKVGENVYRKQAFLTLPDLSEMQVVLAVHEADISRVKVGQRAFVVVETARDRTIEAEVTRVALVPNASRRRWSDDTKRFEVEVSLRGDLEALEMKPGLTSRVEILVEEMKGVLAVPVQCVFAERGEYWVFKRGANGYKRTPVEIRPGNAQYAVISSGLSDGDEVALYNPERAAESGSGTPPVPTPKQGGSGNGRP